MKKKKKKKMRERCTVVLLSASIKAVVEEASWIPFSLAQTNTNLANNKGPGTRNNFHC